MAPPPTGTSLNQHFPQLQVHQKNFNNFSIIHYIHKQYFKYIFLGNYQAALFLMESMVFIFMHQTMSQRAPPLEVTLKAKTMKFTDFQKMSYQKGKKGLFNFSYLTPTLSGFGRIIQNCLISDNVQQTKSYLDYQIEKKTDQTKNSYISFLRKHFSKFFEDRFSMPLFTRLTHLYGHFGTCWQKNLVQKISQTKRCSRIPYDSVGVKRQQIIFRHAGDLGNITAKDGLVSVEIRDTVVSLDPKSPQFIGEKVRK